MMSTRPSSRMDDDEDLSPIKIPHMSVEESARLLALSGREDFGPIPAFLAHWMRWYDLRIADCLYLFKLIFSCRDTPFVKKEERAHYTNDMFSTDRIERYCAIITALNSVGFLFRFKPVTFPNGDKCFELYVKHPVYKTPPLRISNCLQRAIVKPMFKLLDPEVLY